MACPAFGAKAVIGRRKEMEDAYTCVPRLHGDALHYFGVFDGHGGADAAVYCARTLHAHLAAALADGAPAATALDRAFREADAGYAAGAPPLALDTLAGAGVDPGATALAALVSATELIVANAGDCRAVFYGADGALLLRTRDHKASCPDERARIEALPDGQILNYQGPRVMGVLATSRGIGDRSLKRYVIPDPEVTAVPRAPGVLLMASDGLWDVTSDADAGALARTALDRAAEKGAGPCAAAHVAATVLIEAALDRGSRDNITVLVVDLRGGEAPNAAPCVGGIGSGGGPGAGRPRPPGTGAGRPRPPGDISNADDGLPSTSASV